MAKTVNSDFLKKIIVSELLKESILHNYQPLNESSLSRVLSEYFQIGFIIVSADRSCEAELGKEQCTPEEIAIQRQKNKQNEITIRQDIRTAGFGFVPTFGGYREKIVDPATGKETYADNPMPEKSFIVPAKKVASTESREDYESLKTLGIELCKKYNQDSFLYKPPSHIDNKAYFINKEGGVEMSFDDVTANNLSQIYFTSLRKDFKKPASRRFSLTENKNFIMYIPNAPRDVSEARNRYGEIFIRINK